MLTVTSYGQRLLIPIHQRPLSRLRMDSTRVYALWGYDYEHNGKNISFAAGEKFDLVEKSNTDWWLVSRVPGEKFFVPANYLKEESSENNAAPISNSPKLAPKPLSPKPVPKAIKQPNSAGDTERLRAKPIPPSSNRRNTNIKNRFEEISALPVVQDVKPRDKKPFGSGATFSFPQASEELKNELSSKLNRSKMLLPSLPGENQELSVPKELKRSSCHERIAEVQENMYDKLDELYEAVSTR